MDIPSYGASDTSILHAELHIGYTRLYCTAIRLDANMLVVVMVGAEVLGNLVVWIAFG